MHKECCIVILSHIGGQTGEGEVTIFDGLWQIKGVRVLYIWAGAVQETDLWTTRQ